MHYLKSIAIWAGILLLITVWLPMLAVAALFDRDPVRYRTGRLFRKLGWSISKINPNWKIEIEGAEGIDDRKPYIVVCNHLSNADIPLISNLPWEMKWVAKQELFETPVIGWMMKMARDISVDRKSKLKKAAVFKKCSNVLDKNVSVMFFPEGTRSRTGMLNRFSDGAFNLAIRKKIEILPLAIDGTQNCLPKKSWTFDSSDNIRLKVFEPVSTEHYSVEDTRKLNDTIRMKIAGQLAEWRAVPVHQVDAMNRTARADGESV